LHHPQPPPTSTSACWPDAVEKQQSKIGNIRQEIDNIKSYTEQSYKKGKKEQEALANRVDNQKAYLSAQIAQVQHAMFEDKATRDKQSLSS
jgi:esterase/lipase